MAEQSRHAKEYTRSSHPTQEVTEVKVKSLVFLLSNKQMLRASMIFLNNVVALNVRRNPIRWNRQPL